MRLGTLAPSHGQDTSYNKIWVCCLAPHFLTMSQRFPFFEPWSCPLKWNISCSFNRVNPMRINCSNVNDPTYRKPSTDTAGIHLELYIRLEFCSVIWKSSWSSAKSVHLQFQGVPFSQLEGTVWTFLIASEESQNGLTKQTTIVGGNNLYNQEDSFRQGFTWVLNGIAWNHLSRTLGFAYFPLCWCRSQFDFPFPKARWPPTATGWCHIPSGP